MKKRKKPLTDAEYQRLKGKIQPIVCSSRWADDVSLLALAAGFVPTSHHIRKDLHRLGIYPPADKMPRAPKRRRPTLMRRCDECGDRWYPPQYLGRRWDVDGRLHRLCDDCRSVQLLPRHARNRDYTNSVQTASMSARAIQALEQAHAILEDASIMGTRTRQRCLASEDEGDLLEEIRVFDETGWVVEVYRNAVRGERRTVYVQRDDRYLAAMRARAAG